MKKIIIFLMLLYPFFDIGYKYAIDDLGSNPVSDWILISGEYALGMLILTLLCTPLRNLLKHAEFSQYKRMFGLFTFFYATVHLLTYAGLDYRFNFKEIYNQIVMNKFILVGFLAWLVLIPLAITSNNLSIRLLKKKWKVLHKLTFVVAALSILHYVLLVKTVLWEPFIYCAILALLVAIRFISLRDFWFQYGIFVKILILVSPILYIANRGANDKPILIENPNAPHVYNAKYFICYEQSINDGETYEVRVNRCNDLWKEPKNVDWEPPKPKSTRDVKNQNLIILTGER